MRSETHQNNKLIGLGMSILLALATILVATALTEATPGTTILLRSHAEIVQDQDRVRLTDVADLEGPDATALADIAVATLNQGQNETDLSLDAVRQALNQQNVHWGRVSLRGYDHCRVSRVSLEAIPVDPQSASLPPMTNPMDEVDLDSAITLRDKVVQVIEQFAGVGRGELQIRFADTDAQTLGLSLWQDRYEFEPLSSSPLGRVPIAVRRYRDNRLTDTYRITADVSRRYMAVVLKQSVARGQTFAPGDVEIREIYVDKTTYQPMTDLAQVVGQTAAGVLRAGEPVFANQVRSPLLVRRGQLVTVRCIAGNLVIKTVARAAGDGSINELIQVRNDRSRLTYAARVTGHQEVVAEAANTGDALAAAPTTTTRSQP